MHHTQLEICGMVGCSKLAAESAISNDEEDPDDADEDPKKVESNFTEKYPPPVNHPISMPPLPLGSIHALQPPKPKAAKVERPGMFFIQHLT
jgi:hypothetical protein